MINAFRCNKVFPQTQIISGLNFKHNSLMQAELAPDKVTHTHIYTYMPAHIHTYQTQSAVHPSTGRKERTIKEGGMQYTAANPAGSLFCLSVRRRER